MEYHTYMSNSKTMQKIAWWLAQVLSAQWMEKTDLIIEQGCEPTFHDLSIFIENRVSIVTTLYVWDWSSMLQLINRDWQILDRG